VALALVDAATIVLGTPAFLMTAHPNISYAAMLASLLKPKAKALAIFGSYGWGGKAVDDLKATVSSLKELEVLEPVLARGVPTAETFVSLDKLAAAIAERHRELSAA